MLQLAGHWAYGESTRALTCFIIAHFVSFYRYKSVTAGAFSRWGGLAKFGARLLASYAHPPRIHRSPGGEAGRGGADVYTCARAYYTQASSGQSR